MYAPKITVSCKVKFFVLECWLLHGAPYVNPPGRLCQRLPAAAGRSWQVPLLHIDPGIVGHSRRTIVRSLLVQEK